MEEGQDVQFIRTREKPVAAKMICRSRTVKKLVLEIRFILKVIFAPQEIPRAVSEASSRAEWMTSDGS